MKKLLLACAPLVVLAGCVSATNEVTTSTASPAEANCLAAVAAQTKSSGVTTRSVTGSEAGTSVMVNVPGAAAPWICATDSAGKITNVMFSGEG